MNKSKVNVNSLNKWDHLKHVIVGRAEGCCIPAKNQLLMPKFQRIQT